MTDATLFAHDNTADPVTHICYAQAWMKVLAFGETVEGTHDKDSAWEWVCGFRITLMHSLFFSFGGNADDYFSLV